MVRSGAGVDDYAHRACLPLFGRGLAGNGQLGEIKGTLLKEAC